MSASVLFIGGSLDGELRGVPKERGRFVVAVRTSPFECRERGVGQDVAGQTEEYEIENGIARLSTLSPNEVAVKLAAFYGKNFHKLSVSCCGEPLYVAVGKKDYKLGMIEDAMERLTLRSMDLYLEASK